MRRIPYRSDWIAFLSSSNALRALLLMSLSFCVAACLSDEGVGASAHARPVGKPSNSFMLVYFLPLTSITEASVTRENARIELDKLVFTDHRIMESVYRYLRPTRRRGVFDPHAIRLVVEAFGKHGRMLVDTEGMIRTGRGDYEMSPRDYCLLNRLLSSFRDAKEATEGPPVHID